MTACRGAGVCVERSCAAWRCGVARAGEVDGKPQLGDLRGAVESARAVVASETSARTNRSDAPEAACVAAHARSTSRLASLKCTG